MIINIHDLQLLCLEGNIRHQAEVVRSVGQGWKSALPHLLLTWHAESAESGEVSAVEDVVQHLLFLPALSDFPAGELQAAVVVGGLQLDLLVVGHSLVDRLAGLRIEVPGENEGAAVTEAPQPGHQVLALLLPDVGQQAALPGLKVGGDHTQLPACLPVLEDESQHHLVGLGLPGCQNLLLSAQQAELLLLEENSAAVRPGVARHVTTGGVGLWAEPEY